MVHFPDDEPDNLPQGPVIVQPFLPAVGEEGEWSLFYFGGQFSHAVIKVARTGDFRVQPQFGGRVRQVMPSPETFDAAQAVLRAVDQDLVYARIDLIRCLDGDLRLMELELIEPNLFLEHAPDHGAAFADAILASID
jgi:glutathione synthase/RimK-type ligase-like ATP-grasp enzyme